MNRTITRETARGIVVRDGKILLIRRSRQNTHGGIDHWLSIPGGGVEHGETPRRTVVREFQEELGVTVSIAGFLAVQDVRVDATRHNYFLCLLKGDDEPRLQVKSEEYERMRGETPNTYEVAWVPLDSSELPHSLFWSYAEAYRVFASFLETGRDIPLQLTTDGDETAAETHVLA
ncbi:MAG TPA: NUDIX domain-containing protein [Candidatus Saccharimonadales bacterium]|nr:NUDIX domain-containing protein [Candidatus Saccharimonadales bacterium]